MKTQVSITVLKESFLSRSTHIKPIWEKSRESSILAYIDSEEAQPLELVPRKEPYLIDFTPGQHAILFKDSDTTGKDLLKGTIRLGTAIATGGFVAGAGGSFGSTFTNTMLATSGTKIKDGIVSFSLNEGDLLKLSCQATLKGTVKVKQLK